MADDEQGPYTMRGITMDRPSICTRDFSRRHWEFDRAEVSLDDGWWAAAIGMAAQQIARTGQAVDLRDVPYVPVT